ncbi:lmo0937 family membrane protein [Paenibacillus sp. MMS20-IR301]|nr:lmo0937 family membrane protein [Paenibacillus sp. MMS20-IR301]WNS44053.1 lmo0937 family membrane protein [Paenibacillus sp. MMS20-IR301]
MLWGLIGLVVVAWLLGFIFDVMGNLIHLLLFVAAVLFVVNLFRGRSRG